jgi:hypothetical protein
MRVRHSVGSLYLHKYNARWRLGRVCTLWSRKQSCVKLPRKTSCALRTDSKSRARDRDFVKAAYCTSKTSTWSTQKKLQLESLKFLPPINSYHHTQDLRHTAHHAHPNTTQHADSRSSNHLTRLQIVLKIINQKLHASTQAENESISGQLAP